MSRADDGSLREFLGEADEILEAITAGLMALDRSAGGGEPDPEVINAIFRGAHSLKGLSSMLGLAQVTELSHKMETLLDALRMGKVPCDPITVDLLLGGVDLLKSLCARLAEGEGAEDPRIQPFVGRLLAAANGSAVASEDDLSALGLPTEALQVLTEYEIHRLRETLKHPKRTLYRVTASFPIESFDTDLEALNEALKGCGEIISTLPSAGAGAEDCLDFDLLFGSKASMAEVRGVAEPRGGRVETLSVPALQVPAPRPREPAAAEIQGQRPEQPAPGGRDGEGELRSLSPTIRVDLGKLESLMNLVGELVLTKGRIQLLGGRLKERMGFTGEALELSKVHKEFERRLSDLQEAVMDVRMVPLGQLFSKLHRVLRRILQDSTKEVDLEITGSDTELDKLIVEDLSDPLIHVIRNAVDHGIEEPEAREAAGKPRRGKVRIDARQRGNHVLITVSDDGAGLSREKIRRKAEARDLIHAGAVLDDRELFDLVFLPGFSTAEEVTELSGRGVGMDVLRKNIARLSGMIELSSEQGRGTTVGIALPITLAIIQALLVRVGAQTYAVPLNSVLETLALDRRQVKALEGRPVLRLRENTLPLVRVEEIFGGPGHRDHPAYAVVVGVAEKRVAFGVDDLLSQQDVVIKSLGRRLKAIRGLAGATDLGDQRTVLVLDVAALVEDVFQCL
ncbi:MAG: chemotaxis protein CheA [Proteobacteria bacterium]|nr:chemotaxis protein CheA [Pseudomonadota bacterium]